MLEYEQRQMVGKEVRRLKMLFDVDLAYVESSQVNPEDTIIVNLQCFLKALTQEFKDWQNSFGEWITLVVNDKGELITKNDFIQICRLEKYPDFFIKNLSNITNYERFYDEQ